MPKDECRRRRVVVGEILLNRERKELESRKISSQTFTKLEVGIVELHLFVVTSSLHEGFDLDAHSAVDGIENGKSVIARWGGACFEIEAVDAYGRKRSVFTAYHHGCPKRG